MTNNPTIDGVSRELLKRCLRETVSRFGESSHTEALRSLLDAPAVERQEPSATLADGIQSLERISASIDARQQRIDAAKTAPEIAALQSTIAQLQARVEYLELELSGVENAKLQLAEKLGCVDEPRWKWLLIAADTLKARIAELERGRGEPVAEVEHGPFDDVGAPQWVRVVTLGDYDLEHIPDGTKLYTAPPAPVAATGDLLPRLAYALSQVGKADHLVDYDAVILAREDLNAYLDATAALNGVKK